MWKEAAAHVIVDSSQLMLKTMWFNLPIKKMCFSFTTFKNITQKQTSSWGRGKVIKKICLMIHPCNYFFAVCGLEETEDVLMKS